MAANNGRKATETAIRNEARKLTGRIAENMAEDVAYDSTVGAAKDISSYVEQYGDPRDNPKQFLEYMGKNAAINTAAGAVMNAAGPVLSGIKRSGKLWKTVERLGPDGKTHKVKVRVKPLERVKAARSAAGEATDILSPRLKEGATQGAKGAQENLTFSAVKNAMHDKKYLDDIRKNGINGKSVRQVAAEEGKSISDVVADDYAKRYGDTLDFERNYKRQFYPETEGRSATGNRVAHRPGYEPQAEQPLSATEAVTATPELTTTQATTQTTPRATEAATGATRQAESTGPDALDTSMGGTRTGAEAGESQAAYTVQHAKGMTKEDTAEIKKYMSDTSADRKWSEKNADALNKVADRINSDGVNESVVSLRRKFEDNQRWTNEDTAESVILSRRLTEMKRAAEKAGDTDTAKRLGQQRDQIVAINAIEASETGKGLQAMKLYNSLTPDGRVHSALLLKARMEQKLGPTRINVDESLYDDLRNAKTAKEIQAAKDKIAVAYWDQVPPTITEKLSAWRYLSMLGNPKTHIRNVVGNTVFMLPRAIKNALATGAERIALPKSERTKAIVNPLTDSKFLKKAKSEWDEVKDTFMNGSEKFESTTRRPEGSRVFALKPLQAVSNFNTWALTKEDEIFAEIAYKNAYAGFLKAKGIDPAKASKEVLEKARAYAWDEALTATYRESSIIADKINSARKGANISLRDFRNAKNGEEMKRLILNKTVGTAADALVPFAKTPANILKEGIYYSPAGIVRGLGKLAQAKTPEAVADVIDALAQGVTGTGLLLLGYLAAKNGLVKSSIDTDYNTNEGMLGTYDQDRGVQEYSFIVGGDTPINKFELFNKLNSKTNGKQYSVTGDSLVPAAMPFFFGAQLADSIGDTSSADSADNLEKFANATANMAKLSDPVLNLSMLSSVQNAFSTWQSGGSALSSFAQNTMQSRLGQYVPTIGGQFVNTMRDAKPSASPVRSGVLGNWESFGRQQANKIPGADRINADKSDAFGQKINKKPDKEPKTYLQSALVNFGSPFNIREVRNTPADKEIQHLVTDEGQSPEGLLPKVQKTKDIRKKFGEQDFKVTQKDVADYNEAHGQYALEHINKLVDSKKYKKASTEEKVDLIKEVYNDATKYANEQFAKSKGMSDREIMLVNMDSRKKDTYLEREANMEKLGVDNDTYARVWKKVGKAQDTLENRNVYMNSNRAKIVQTLAAAEVDGGVRKAKQAEAATGLDQDHFDRVVNLYNAGYTAKRAAKLAFTQDEFNRLKTSPKSSYLNKNAVIAYINSKNISRREKWACFEVNKQKGWTNPF
jgi:hypothetical protein